MKAPLVLKIIGPVGYLTQKTSGNDCHQRILIINKLQLPPSSSQVAFTFELFSYLYFLLYISPHHCVSIINRLHFPSISPHPKLRVLIMNLVGIYQQHLTNTFCILASNGLYEFIPNSNTNANTNVIVCVDPRENAIRLQKYKYKYK